MATETMAKEGEVRNSKDQSLHYESWDQYLDNSMRGKLKWTSSDVLHVSKWFNQTGDDSTDTVSRPTGVFVSLAPINLSKAVTTPTHERTFPINGEEIEIEHPAVQIVTEFNAVRRSPFNSSSPSAAPHSLAGTECESTWSTPQNAMTYINESVDGLNLNELMVTSIRSRKIIIRSVSMFEALRKHTSLLNTEAFVEEPYQEPSPLDFIEPFHELLQNFGVLKKLGTPCIGPSNQCIIDHKSADSEACAGDHYSFRMLLHNLGPSLDQIEDLERHLNEDQEPSVFFDQLWYLYPRNSVVYAKSGGYEAAGLAATIQSIGEHHDHISVCINTLFLSNESIHVRQRSVTIRRFEGKQKIKDLLLCPARLWDRLDQGKRRQSLMERGHRYKGLVKLGYKEMFYNGPSLFLPEGGNLRQIQYRGNIVLDHCAAYEEKLATVAKLSRYLGTYNARGQVAADVDSDPVYFPESMQPQSLDTAIPLDHKLTETMILTLDNKSVAFAIKDKVWIGISIDYLHEIERQPDPLANVIMAKEDMEMIQALSFRQRRAMNVWNADFVEAKGAGQIILLHGPPGVGKTYTVECIAEWFRKPLLSLTVANIGTNGLELENELSIWFSLAERWDAILLIDEADVFLERRRNSDLERNGLVAALLRRLEYYTGLLFLTTNRVGQIDDAFASRIHVVIGYSKLNHDARYQIWDMFFAKLEKEQDGKIYVGKHARTYVQESEDVESLDWNGREIRNALQTAIALADFEASKDLKHRKGQPIIVEKEHFERVVKMRKNFNDYMVEVAKGNEPQRALTRKDRVDHFRKS